MKLYEKIKESASDNKKYKVTVTEVLKYEIEVESENSYLAQRFVEALYYEDKLEPDEDILKKVEFSIEVVKD